MNERYEAIYNYIAGITKKSELFDENSIGFLISWMLGISDVKTCRDIEFRMLELKSSLEGFDMLDDHESKELFKYNFNAFTNFAYRIFLVYGLFENNLDMESALIKLGVYTSECNSNSKIIKGSKTLLSLNDFVKVQRTSDEFKKSLFSINPANRISRIKAYNLSCEILNFANDPLLDVYSYYRYLNLWSGYFSNGNVTAAPTIDFLKKWGFEHVLNKGVFKKQLSFNKDFTICNSDLEEEMSLTLGFPYKK